MASDIKRFHYYHADASAISGYIETPIDEQLPVVAPLSLSPIGGYASSRSESVQFQGFISIDSAYTQVAGSISHKTGGWTTLATSVVEGLNVLDVVTADRMVAQIATEHPRAGYNPKVSFLGTRFENLRVAGSPIEAAVNLNLCQQASGPDGYPQTSLFDDKNFRSAAEKQARAMTGGGNASAWVGERCAWDNGQLEKRAVISCSLVTQVSGKFPGTPYGHVLEVPEIGKVFLGELLVDHNTFRLIMMRLELGCVTSGAMAGCVVSIEGSTSP